MGMHKYVNQSFQDSMKRRTEAFRKRIRDWNDQEGIIRVEKPTNIARARELGYRASREIIVVRVRVRKGKRVREPADLGRKPAKNRKKENPGKKWQWFAEVKAWKKHRNMKLIGSYYAGADGMHSYYEVILKGMHSRENQSVKKASKPLDKTEGKKA